MNNFRTEAQRGQQQQKIEQAYFLTHRETDKFRNNIKTKFINLSSEQRYSKS